MASVRARRCIHISAQVLFFLLALCIVALWIASYFRVFLAPVGDRLFALGYGTLDWWHRYDIPDGDISVNWRDGLSAISIEQIWQIPGRLPLAVVSLAMFGWLFVRPVLSRLSRYLSPARGRLSKWAGGALLILSLAAWCVTQYRVVHLRSPIAGVCGYLGSAWIGFPDRSASKTVPWSAGIEPTDYLPRSCMSCESSFIGHKIGSYSESRVNFLWPALVGLGLWAIGRAARFNLQQQGLCPSCGYSRMGDTSERCPECGSPERPKVSC